jgi:hypothetical protein
MLILTLLIMTILITLHTSDITCNNIPYNGLYFKLSLQYMALLIIVNKNTLCNVTFINVIRKVIIHEVFLSIAVSKKIKLDENEMKLQTHLIIENLFKTETAF